MAFPELNLTSPFLKILTAQSDLIINPKYLGVSCRSAYGKLWENSNHVKATGARLTSGIFSSEFRMNPFHTLLSSPHWII